jgi:hypothetical protein
LATTETHHVPAFSLTRFGRMHWKEPVLSVHASVNSEIIGRGIFVL